MSQKAFCLIAGILFAIVAIVHLSRVIQGWDIIIVTWAVPMWISWIGVVIPGILAFFGLKFGMRD